MSERLLDYINIDVGLKTIILDLDETLVHSWTNPTFVEAYNIYNDSNIYRKFYPHGQHQIAFSIYLDKTRIWGLYRPNIYKFLNFINEYFDNIIIWSAGIRPYVTSITEQLFLDTGLPLPKIVWARNKCSNTDGYYHKPISTMIYDLKTKHYNTFDIDMKTTIIIDDKTYTFMKNPKNGILIPPWYPGKNRPGNIPTLEDLFDRSDNALLKIIDFLEQPEVIKTKDISTLNTNIF